MSDKATVRAAMPPRFSVLCCLHLFLFLFFFNESLLPFGDDLNVHFPKPFQSYFFTPQWGAVDAEIKVPSGENTELKRSPF